MSKLSLKIDHFLDRLRGIPLYFDLRPYEKSVAEINRRESSLAALSDVELKDISLRLGEQVRQGASTENFMIEAFALVREAARRVLGMRPFDVQLLAGLALHEGKIVEMQTGEGKTLAAVAPAYLKALTGQGIHVLTFNDYLARRDAQWMGPVYEFLNLSVSYIQEGMSRAERKKAYAADITYGTAKEAGFDYLRDQLAVDVKDLVHRPFHFAIVDEADSLLIDEARIPLVIAGSTDPQAFNPQQLAKVAHILNPGEDFEVDEHEHEIFLTPDGAARIEAMLGCGNLHDPHNQALLTGLNLALRAERLLRRDIDYIVREGQVELVDEFTGRVAQNRRWPDGLQPALEAKEGLKLRQEGEILGSLTLQHFMRLYPKFSGMTATAVAAAEEFQEFYGLETVIIPPNKPCIRMDEEDLIFTTKPAKERALVEEIKQVHQTGRPILVGTRSVQESEKLADELARAAVSCQVLNAKNDAMEAKIVERAGALNAVTISTNMAGRGTDIRLGPSSDDEREKILALGGLYVIGTNRHESRRIDDQLRGRSGRQDDPGSSRFFISLEDDLFQRYGLRDQIPESFRDSRQEAPATHSKISREVARAQRILEGENLSIRKMLWQYSTVLEEQRRIIRRKRDDMLHENVDFDLAAQKAPERRRQVLEKHGPEVLKKALKQITLYHLDQGWTSHLAQVADIREGIYLVNFSGSRIFGMGLSPVTEFHRRIHEAFVAMLDRIDEEIVRTFEKAAIGENGVDMQQEGLIGPASTWTYLINDQPFGNEFQRFFRGLKKRLFARWPEA